MQVLPQYDEFGIYTSTEDVKDFVISLFESGITEEFDVIDQCVDRFGTSYRNLIEKVLYGED
jgi:hypothetical protein